MSTDKEKGLQQKAFIALTRKSQKDLMAAAEAAIEKRGDRCADLNPSHGVKW